MCRPIVLTSLLFVTAPLFAQAPGANASAEFAKNEQARRAATTQVSVGELDDLRAKVQMLSAQVAALNNRLTVTAAKPQAPHRYTEIEVGMS